jgi:hypothetical protein
MSDTYIRHCLQDDCNYWDRECQDCNVWIEDGRPPLMGVDVPPTSDLDAIREVVRAMRECADAMVEGNWNCRLRDLLDWADCLESALKGE